MIQLHMTQLTSKWYLVSVSIVQTAVHSHMARLTTDSSSTMSDMIMLMGTDMDTIDFP